MGFFGKIFSALKKTKDSIAQKLTVLFTGDRIGADFYDDLEEILISSDISVNTAMEIVDDLRDRMIKDKVKDKDYVVAQLKEILKEYIDRAEPLELKFPAVIMVIGVNGVGKTTSIGKLARYFTSKGKSVTIAAADTFRAAASDQLTVWADRAKVRIVKHEEGADPSAVVYDAVSSAKARKTDILIIDTAGRLHVKSNLMEELKKMNRVVSREFPEATFYKFIVLDATTGQNALNQVEAFKDAIGIDSIILTKLDGTAKGGFVVALCNELEVPVSYVGVGEKIDDLEEFNTEDFVNGLL